MLPAIRTLKRGDESTPHRVPDDRPRERVGGGTELVCARCLSPITNDRERIEVDGAHQHRGANPHGYRFLYGCFAAAPGCRERGDETSHWSWHKGFSWQLVHCAGCDVHLGWYFRGAQLNFHGLVVDRLRHRPEGNSS